MRSLIPWGRSNAVTNTRSEEAPHPFFALHRQMDRLFDDFFRDFDMPARGAWPASGPSIALSDTGRELKVIAELPGLDEKDIDVTLHDGVLTLKGEKKIEESGAHYSERWQGRFERAVELGSDVDPDKVRAKFDKGVLSITLEKRPEAQASVKRIAINGKD